MLWLCALVVLLFGIYSIRGKGRPVLNTWPIFSLNAMNASIIQPIEKKNVYLAVALSFVSPLVLRRSSQSKKKVGVLFEVPDTVKISHRKVAARYMWFSAHATQKSNKSACMHTYVNVVHGLIEFLKSFHCLLFFSALKKAVSLFVWFFWLTVSLFHQQTTYALVMCGFPCINSSCISA